MRRVSYKSVQSQVAEFLGWDPDNLGTPEAASINRFFNRRGRFGWDAFYWPEWTLLQKRSFRKPWNSTDAFAAQSETYYRASAKYYGALRASTNQAPATLTGGLYVPNLDWWAESQSSYEGAPVYNAASAYVKGNQVYYPDTDEFYQLYVATSTGNAPTDTSRWGRLVRFERTIDYTQSWEATPIGAVKAVWDANKRVQRANEIDFELQENGARVLGTETIVWVEFRKQSPSWSGTIYNAATTYALDDQAWDPTGGDYYRSLVGSNTGNAVTDTTKWERIDVPYVLSAYIAEGAYADVLGKTEGQQDKYPTESDEAFGLLTHEWDVIERQQKQDGQLNMRL